MFWRGQQPLSHDKLYLKGMFKIWGQGKKQTNIKKGFTVQFLFNVLVNLQQAKSKHMHACSLYCLCSFVRTRRRPTLNLVQRWWMTPKSWKRFSYPLVELCTRDVPREEKVTSYWICSSISDTSMWDKSIMCLCSNHNDLWVTFISSSKQHYQYQKVQLCKNFTVTCKIEKGEECQLPIEARLETCCMFRLRKFGDSFPLLGDHYKHLQRPEREMTKWKKDIYQIFTQ